MWASLDASATPSRSSPPPGACTGVRSPPIPAVLAHPRRCARRPSPLCPLTLGAVPAVPAPRGRCPRCARPAGPAGPHTLIGPGGRKRCRRAGPGRDSPALTRPCLAEGVRERGAGAEGRARSGLRREGEERGRSLGTGLGTGGRAPGSSRVLPSPPRRPPGVPRLPLSGRRAAVGRPLSPAVSAPGPSPGNAGSLSSALVLCSRRCCLRCSDTCTRLVSRIAFRGAVE